MSRRRFSRSLPLVGLGLWAGQLLSSGRAVAVEPVRESSISIDDLPAVNVARGDLAALAIFTDKLLANFTANQVPVIGFVNEGKLSASGEGLDGQAARTPLLSADSYVGRWGISWMHHWEQAMGRPRTGSPDPPAWVSAAYEKERR